METKIHSSKLIGILLLLIAPDIIIAATQETASPQLTTTATLRARRDRVMQAAPDALGLVRSRSTVMAENEDGFRQNAQFYYLTGLDNAIGALLLMDSRRHESWLFVPAAGQLPRVGSLLRARSGYVESGQDSRTSGSAGLLYP